MAEIPILPAGKVPVGKDRYTFTERQGEEDVSGKQNYPNQITITVNRDIAWQTAMRILEELRYHPSNNTIDLIVYGQLAEKAEV